LKINKYKKKPISFNWILSEHFGFDIKKFILAISSLPKFFIQLIYFRKIYQGKIFIKPCLHDVHEDSSGKLGEYFYQDLFVSNRIFKANPYRHIDIGSRIDGFVSNIATFRKIEVLDVRQLSYQITNVSFNRVDLLSKNFYKLKDDIGLTDSLSCLHTMEHFGLGRYGDQLSIAGIDCGIKNLSSLLTSGGILYLSVPTGVDAVYFNSHHVFHADKIINIANANNLRLVECFTVTDLGVIKVESNQINHQEILVIFIFEKN
jgi:hypothetical protein